MFFPSALRQKREMLPRSIGWRNPYVRLGILLKRKRVSSDGPDGGSLGRDSAQVAVDTMYIMSNNK
jgi:hypothetical protein